MGFLVQFILAFICFFVLVVKRFTESPRRPWKIWFFDISKQGVSATVIHLLNLLLAVLLSTNGKSDQCIWYFIGNLIDTTIGVFICFIMMYYIEKTANQNNWKSLQSGLYYEILRKDDKIKTKLNLKMYFSQLFCWVIVVSLSKTILFFIQFFIPTFLEIIGEFILSPLRYNGTLKLIFIMIIIPGILNATQFWIQDNILKFKGNEEISNEKLCQVRSETNSESDSMSEGTKSDSILPQNKSFDKENNML